MCFTICSSTMLTEAVTGPGNTNAITANNDRWMSGRKNHSPDVPTFHGNLRGEEALKSLGKRTCWWAFILKGC